MLDWSMVIVAMWLSNKKNMFSYFSHIGFCVLLCFFATVIQLQRQSYNNKWWVDMYLEETDHYLLQSITVEIE
jgi:coproporphyrinogen III oxidase-like Fe-S oxidoreductase